MGIVKDGGGGCGALGGRGGSPASIRRQNKRRGAVHEGTPTVVWVYEPSESVYVTSVHKALTRDVCGGGWGGTEIHRHRNVGAEAVVHELVGEGEALAGRDDRSICGLDGGTVLGDDIGLAPQKGRRIDRGKNSEEGDGKYDEGTHLGSVDADEQRRSFYTRVVEGTLAPTTHAVVLWKPDAQPERKKAVQTTG